MNWERTSWILACASSCVNNAVRMGNIVSKPSTTQIVALVFGCAFFVAPTTSGISLAVTAQAAKHHRASHSKHTAKSSRKTVSSAAKSAPSKTAATSVPGYQASKIAHESELTPHQDVAMDSSIATTKDTQPKVVEQKKPTLTAFSSDPNDIQTQMDSKIDEEIQLLEQAIAFENGCEEVSKLRFRLSDLIWEKSKRYFFKANDFSTPESERTEYQQQMKRVQSDSIAGYRKIIDECPKYSELPKIIFSYGRSLTELEQYKEALPYFERIISDYPKSDFVPQAYFMLGEYYFNTANDVIHAMRNYDLAANFRVSPVYAYAVYKQGWCFINVAEWDKAMQRFLDVIHIVSDSRQPLEDKERARLRREALTDYVRAYANVGDPHHAKAVFASIAKPEELPRMLEKLGDWYIGQGAHINVATIYRQLIDTYPRSTHLPLWHARIVDAVSRLSNPQNTVKEVQALTRAFLNLRTRIEKRDLSESEQKSIDKDVSDAEDIAENTVRHLATDAHKEAQKLRGVGQEQAYRFALALYREYLNVFPESKPHADVDYSLYIRFYYAQVLYHENAYLEAATNYDRVVIGGKNITNAKEKEIIASAAEEAVRSYNNVVDDQDRKHPPVIGGAELKEIPAIKKSLIDACKRYVDYVGVKGDKIVEIQYKMARIYYTYNHFDKAAPIFDEIVTQHPKSPVACYSANLALDIYNGQKNYLALRNTAAAYVKNQDLACDEADKKRFIAIEEQSSFHLIKQDLEDKKKYIAAGNAYMAFYRAHTQSDLADEAVYNAAVNYDLGNRLDKATEVRQFLVSKMPNSPLVPETLFNMAQSFERIVDFKQAANYLEMFSKRYPKDARSKDAIYNAAIYHASLHDYAAAMADQHDFIQIYPDDAEASKVAMSMCEAQEQQAQKKSGDAARSDADELKVWKHAHDCYFSLIKNKKWANDNPDLLCKAQFRRLQIMREHTHYEQGVDEQRRYLSGLWSGLKAKGAQNYPQCADAVAQMMFDALEPAQKKYESLIIGELNPTDKGKKNFDWTVHVKVTARDRLIAQYRDVAAIGVPQWALAALYDIGEAYNESIDKLLHAPIPKKIPGYQLTEEDKALLRQKLQEMAQPIENLAIEAYKLCVSKANELGVYNDWSMKALSKLQKLRPMEYPIVEEQMEQIHIEQPLIVQKNDLVIVDGDTVKPIKVLWPVASAPMPPKPSTPVAEQSVTAAPVRAAEQAEQKTDAIPAPVEE